LRKLILLGLIIAIALFANFSDQPVTDFKISINDEIIELETPVRIVEGEILVPAEPVLKNLGAELEWDEDEKVLYGVMGDFKVNLAAESNEILVDGEKEKLDFPVKFWSGKIFSLPEPPVEAVGAFVEKDLENKLINISTPAIFDPLDPGDPEGPILNVTYPPGTETYHYADTIYVFGTTDSYSQVEVRVNEEPVDRHDPRTGNFLTMVDLPRGEEVPIKIEATDERGTTVIKRSAIYPDGWQKMSDEPLAFHSMHLIPSQNQVLSPGDTLHVAFQATPGASAYFQVGGSGLIRMTEYESPWGSEGEGGIYRGTYTVSENDAPGSGTSAPMPVTGHLYRGNQHQSRQMPGQASFTARPVYQIIEVTDQEELGWFGWLRLVNENNPDILSDTLGGTGYAINVTGYLQEGNRYEATGSSGNYFRVSPNNDDTYLIHTNAVRVVDDTDRLSSTLSAITLRETKDKIRLQFNTDQRIPYIVEENEAGAKKLTLQLYGIEVDDELDKPDLPGLINSLELKPTNGNNNETTLTIDLTQKMTGFKTDWDNSELVIEIYKPPVVDRENPLAGKTILIDPGHGGEDPGALGPADFHEKDSALEMSLFLRDMLLEAGSEVLMTREEDVSAELYGRTDSLPGKKIDFFISIHSNAHGPGGDAVETHGIMTLYNYDHNEKLAEVMLEVMGEEMGLPEIRTWRRKIAVLRHTEVPSILVEAGYMMHPEDNWYIFHPRGQKQFAEAMKKGIEEYFLILDNSNQ